MDRRCQFISIQLTPSSASAAVGAAELQARSGGMDMPADLYLAACEGRTPAVMAMLRKLDGAGTPSAAGGGGGSGNGMHCVSAGGNTLLHLAASEGHDELIRELYANFGKSLVVSSKNSVLDTPLHCTARAGHTSTVCLLLQLAWECGGQSSMSCKNEAGDTALHLAARLGHGAAVEAMVSQAPEIASEVNYAGVSPLYMAVISRSVAAVRAITIGCVNASAAGPSLQNALHAAVFQGSEMVGILLQWKPSLASDVDGSGSSPLHFASSDGDRSIVSAIIRAAPPSTARMRDSDGRSALHVAAGMGHSDIVKELLKACADAAELRDDRGGTFLHAAAKGGHSKVVALAIKKPTLHGLLDMQDGDGNTPLHLAVDAGASNIAEDLILHGGACASVMNNEGLTALDLATKSTNFFSMLNLVVTLMTFGSQSRPQRQDQVDQWNDGGKISNGIQKSSNGLAVVAVLIATVAFSAANNVPGTYDDKGKVVLQGMIIFRCYIILNSVALVASVMAVLLLIYGMAEGSTRRSLTSFAVALHFIWVSLIAMIMAFYAAMAAVTTIKQIPIVTYTVLFILIPVLTKLAMNLITHPLSIKTTWKFLCCNPWKGRHAATRRQVGRKYPFANAYVPNMLLFHLTYIVAIAGIVIVSILDDRQGARYSPAPAPAPAPLPAHL